MRVNMPTLIGSRWTADYTLGRWPEQLEAWHAFNEERQLGRARAWLADQGYTPG
jgi:hypothetical protein